MFRGRWGYALTVFLATGGWVFAQSASSPPNAEQPADWHQSWDKPLGEKSEASEKKQTSPSKPVTVPAQPVSRESPSIELPEMHIDQTTSPPSSPAAGEVIFSPTESPPSTPTSEWSEWTRKASWETTDLLSHDVHLILEDYGNYFTWQGMGEIALGVALAAPIANTSADLSIRNWYQRHNKEPWEESYAYSIKNAGEYTYALPAYFAIAIAGKGMQGLDSVMFDDGSWIGEVGQVSNEWGQRCIRAMAVGTPMVGLLQVGLGSTRPSLGSSYWNPLAASHGVSGHAYVGSIPFLTAASMTDSSYLKVPLVLASCLTGWSRIQTDDHYFSQVALGWWMGYLAVRAVNRTQDEERSIEFLPGSSEGPGVSMLLRY